MGLRHVFQAPPHHFGEGSFAIFGYLLGFLIEFVRNLNLCLDHDGKLPWVVN